jgi:aspartate ammonia-lyase
MKKRYRTERDFLGSRKIPSSAYYGVQTQRALENFQISGLHFSKDFIDAMVIIKRSAALANMKAKQLDPTKGRLIVRSCDDILQHKLDDQFLVDVFQAGAGTSEHMNVNEVIANRGLELAGKKKGSYQFLHPNDHVNLSQSTNDVFHSAIHVASYRAVHDELLPALVLLERALRQKSRQWKSVTKSGRTHLRDAVPMTLGQEFGSYATAIWKDQWQLRHTMRLLLELNLGGTAIGSGINASAAYRREVYQQLRKITHTPFRPTKNLFEETSSLGSLQTVSGSLRGLATTLIKLANDLRLLGSGPVTGFDELELPAVQPGSSIMPGKVNPAMAEMMDMVGYRVISNDVTLSLCSQAGQLELNVMMPLAAYALLESIHLLSRGIEAFTLKCVRGLRANTKTCHEYLEKNPIVVTAFTPLIGYEKAAHVAKRAYREDKTIRQVLFEERLLDKKTIETVLRSKQMRGQ